MADKDIVFNEEEVQKLKVMGIIGFNSRILDCIHLHPDDQHFIYSLGRSVLVREVTCKKQYQFEGHNDNISVIKISKDGRFIASGEKNNKGIEAKIIIWNFN